MAERRGLILQMMPDVPRGKRVRDDEPLPAWNERVLPRPIENPEQMPNAREGVTEDRNYHDYRDSLGRFAEKPRKVKM